MTKTTAATTRLQCPASTTAQRTTCSSSGLFDTGTAVKEGFFPVDINEINTPDVYKVISGSTLFQTKSDASDISISIPLEGSGLEHLEVPPVESNEITLDAERLPLALECENVTTLENVPLVESAVVTADGAAVVEGKDTNVSGVEAEFLEGFCDLSSFTDEGGTEKIPDMIDISCLSDGNFEQDLIRLLRKRPLTETCTKSSVNQPSESSSTAAQTPGTQYAAVNTDHDMYTCNAKQSRLTSTCSSRLSSTSSELTQCDDDSADLSAINKSSHKYAERRRKNNIASRRSRQTRKQKFASMEQRAEDLERTNAQLEEKVVELENLTKMMKQVLVEKLSTKTIEQMQ